ncbi:hypothetical protein ACSBR1_026773 [Camellia fascicularis]
MKVETKSNSEMTINKIHNRASGNSPYKALIEDAKFVFNKCKCIIGHILREMNKCADKLANLGMK